MLVKLAFVMQRLKNIKKNFCHDQQRWGGGNFWILWGGQLLWGGDIELMGVPPLGKPCYDNFGLVYFAKQYEMKWNESRSFRKLQSCLAKFSFACFANYSFSCFLNYSFACMFFLYRKIPFFSIHIIKHLFYETSILFWNHKNDVTSLVKFHSLRLVFSIENLTRLVTSFLWF